MRSRPTQAMLLCAAALASCSQAWAEWKLTDPEQRYGLPDKVDPRFWASVAPEAGDPTDCGSIPEEMDPVQCSMGSLWIFTLWTPGTRPMLVTARINPEMLTNEIELTEDGQQLRVSKRTIAQGDVRMGKPAAVNHMWCTDAPFGPVDPITNF